MKLKYYLRGLGIGIAVTALLMGYSGQSGQNPTASDKVQSASEKKTLKEAETQTMTDALESETKQMTVTQMMTEENPTSEQTEELSSEEAELSSEDLAEQNHENIQEKASAMQDEAEQMKAESEQMKSEVNELQSEQEELKSSAELSSEPADMTTKRPVSIVVSRGDGSGTVARKLELAGIVENASEFDAYLMQHGYDKKITVGTHTVIPGSSWNEIAKKITE